MQIIKESDIKWLTRHNQDPLGYVFRYERRILRGIAELVYVGLVLGLYKEKFDILRLEEIKKN